MRILQVNSLFNGGGVDTQTLELCTGLVGAGHDVTIAINEGARWAAHARGISGLRVETIRGGKLAQGLQLRRLARRFGANILHAHHGRDYWTTGLASKLASNGAVAVLTRHLMTPLSRTSGRHLLKLGHVVAVSKAVQAQLSGELKGNHERLHQIYSGVDTERFRPDPQRQPRERVRFGWDASHVVFSVIGAANLPDGKGQREFVEAGARLIRADRRVRLLIVGEGSLVPQLKARVHELGFAEQIRFTGFVDDVERITTMIDVLVHPAVGTEALGLVLWEAMACGKPVIASRLGGIPEAFVDPDHGMLVEPGNADQLHDAMSRYAADQSLREKSGALARQYIFDRAYTREGQARRFVDLYARITAGA